MLILPLQTAELGCLEIPKEFSCQAPALLPSYPSCCPSQGCANPPISEVQVRLPPLF